MRDIVFAIREAYHRNSPPNTMKAHVRHIRRKFDTSTVKEAAEKAGRLGLMDITDNK